MRKQTVFAIVTLAAAFAAAGSLIAAPIASAAPIAKRESQNISKTQDTFTSQGITCTFSYKAHLWHCRRA